MTGYSPTDFQDFIKAASSSLREIPQPTNANGSDADNVSINSEMETEWPDTGHVRNASHTENSIQERQDTICNEGSIYSEISSRNLNQRTEKQGVDRDNILPEILLFKSGTGVKIVDTAESLGKIYEKKEILFRRISADSCEPQVQTVGNDRSLTMLSAALACSEFEKVAAISTFKEHKTVHAVLSEKDTRLILCCPHFVNRLPPLRILAKCPVIVESPEGGTKIVNTYDRHTGIFAMGDRPLEMDVDDAIKIVLSSIEEFSFQSPADQSRALASIITPALIMGGIGKFRSPIDLIEADESQAGKGFKTRISAAYYNESPYSINQQRGGVGSMEESLNQALIEGRIFINLDNLKPVKNGVFDSEKLCSIMTEDVYYARMLRKGMFINPRMHIIQVTTNGCSLSKDLMNRASPIAIRKRKGHSFKKYPEGSILDHIRHNQSKFLGAVFAIIRAWVGEGKPRTETTAHESSFTPWVQCMDWIVQNIMGQVPLLDGYQHVRERITSQYLQNLREIALVIMKLPHHKEWLTASDILDIVGPEGVELPGIDSPYNFDTMADDVKENVKRQLGSSFMRAFKYHGNNDLLDLGGIRIVRKEIPKKYNYRATKDIKHYKFWLFLIPSG